MHHTHNHEHEHSHEHAHKHSHTHDDHNDIHEEYHNNGVTKDEELLKVLLGHWVVHNQSHAEEYKKWIKKTKDMNNLDLSERLKKAVSLMEEVDKLLLECKLFIK